MHVIGLQINNVRKIKALEFEFGESGLIQIRGKNSQGKTTIIDSIEMLLKGTKFTPKDVISHGESKAKIIGQLGDYIIERELEQGKNRIKVTTKEGHIIKSPQSFLNDLVNELTFDPRPLLDKSPQEKLRFLMQLLKIDFTDQNNKISEKEQERLFIGREVKAIGEIMTFAKTERVVVSDLVVQKDRIEDRNRDRRNAAEMRKKFHEEVEQKRKELAEAEKGLKIWSDQVDNLGEIESTEELTTAIQTAEETNSLAMKYEDSIKKKAEKSAKQTAYDELTQQIQSLRKEKEAVLRETKMPVKGLEIRDDGVYYDGIYSENWSDSESMRISFELAVAMQPELKAVFIDKGESYDAEGLKQLEKWAKKNDIQAFITIVDSSEDQDVEGAIYIEEGELKK